MFGRCVGTEGRRKTGRKREIEELTASWRMGKSGTGENVAKRVVATERKTGQVYTDRMKPVTYVYPVQSSTWSDPWLTAATSHSVHWSAERSMAA